VLTINGYNSRIKPAYSFIYIFLTTLVTIHMKIQNVMRTIKNDVTHLCKHHSILLTSQDDHIL